MPPRPTRPDTTQPIVAAVRPIVLPGAIIELRNTEWFRPLAPDIRLKPGTPAPELVRVPEAAANAILRSVIHLVADIRADAPPDVVWTHGANEVQVLLDRTRLALAPGFVSIGLVVRCDELREPQRMDVAFAVGSKGRPTGLVMSTFERVQGPALIADTWSGALTAFAWELLVTIAQQIAAGIGKDVRGRPLLPGSIAADKDLLLIGAMARHDLSWVDGQ